LAAKDRSLQLFNESNYLVIGIPTTGIHPGIAYANYLNIEYSQSITKNININRTFILSKEERDIASKKKYIYNDKTILGKRIIVIDDSIVRGITMRNIVYRLNECGAKEVHIRIISPEIKNTCMYGIDIPTKEELIANSMNNAQMNDYFGSTTLRFLDTLDMRDTINTHIKETNFCSGCFDGNYGYNEQLDNDKLSW
jgi:amidophosphoribosyltransferase